MESLQLHPKRGWKSLSNIAHSPTKRRTKLNPIEAQLASPLLPFKRQNNPRDSNQALSLTSLTLMARSPVVREMWRSVTSLQMGVEDMESGLKAIASHEELDENEVVSITA